MHIKYALARNEDDSPTLQLVTPGKNVKTAGVLPAVSSFLEQLSPCSDRTYALGTALSDSKYFGSNSNADWYGYNPHLRMNGLTWDPDKTNEHGDYTGWRTDPVVQQRLAKNWPYGYPTFYGANVFAHHKNHDPVLGFGDVMMAYWNDVMKRVELVMRINNRQAAEKGHSGFLERLHTGKRVDLSMGCKIPFDACSICTDWGAVHEAMSTYNPKVHAHPGIPVLEAHRKKKIRGIAETRIEYCPCMVNQKNQILPDGRRVYVYNDFIKFFDISCVWIGADKTAKVMAVIGGTAKDWRRPVAKKAEMEKEIPGGVAEILEDARTSPEIGSLSVFKKPPSTVLSTMATLGIIPTPSEFMRLVMPAMGEDAVLQKCQARGVIFNINTPGIDRAYDFKPSEVDPHLAHVLGPWMGERSALEPHLSKRLKDPRRKKEAHVPLTALESPVLDDVARKYAGFRLGVIENIPKIVKTLDDLSVGWTEHGKMTPEFAGLLLGIGTVVHLFASHLHDKETNGEQVGALQHLMAKNPGFSALASMGIAMRAAVEADKAGGITKALGKLVRTIA